MKKCELCGTETENKTYCDFCELEVATQMRDIVNSLKTWTDGNETNVLLAITEWLERQ